MNRKEAFQTAGAAVSAPFPQSSGRLDDEIDHDEGRIDDIFQVKAAMASHSKENTPKKSGAVYNTPMDVLALLIVLGSIAGLLNGLILWGNKALDDFQVYIINHSDNYSLGMFNFCLSSVSCVCLSAYLCKTFASQAAGSGLPELKSLLANEQIQGSDYTNLVSAKILLIKIIGLTLCIGSCLSIGSEGPLVHTAACIAHLLMKYGNQFAGMLESETVSKQIFAASVAVGVSSAFNAPVGGLLFSIEVTSTFYLVSNYWKSFIAAVAGSVMCNLFLITKGSTGSDVLVVLTMAIVDKPFVKFELAVFLLMGVSFGYLACLFLRLHQRLNLSLKAYNKSRPIITAGCVALFSAILVYSTNSVRGVVTLVSDVLSTGEINQLTKAAGVSDLGGLVASFFIRTTLTLLGTNIFVPAGIFMPVFLIGGILGRFVGVVMQSITANTAGVVIDVPAYALVGSCAFASGVTHTISAAVIAVELTGNIHMLLPCLLVSVVAAGIAKANTLSVYDQGMLNKGIESFQLLLMLSGGHGVAGDVADPKALSVSRSCTISALVGLLDLSAATRQAVYPVTVNGGEGAVDVDNAYAGVNKSDSAGPPDVKTASQPKVAMGSRVLGTLSRHDVFTMLRRRFQRAECIDILAALLPEDMRAYEERRRQRELKEAEIRRMMKFRAGLRAFFDRITHESILFGKEDENEGNIELKKVDIVVKSTASADRNDSEEKRRTDPTEATAGAIVLDLQRVARMVDLSLSTMSGQIRLVGDTAGRSVSSLQQHLAESLSSGETFLLGSTADSGGAGAKESAKRDKTAPSSSSSPVSDARMDMLEFMLNTRIDILEDEFFKPRIDLYPFSVGTATPMENVYILFEMVKARCVLVFSDNNNDSDNVPPLSPQHSVGSVSMPSADTAVTISPFFTPHASFATDSAAHDASNVNITGPSSAAQPNRADAASRRLVGIISRETLLQSLRVQVRVDAPPAAGEDMRIST